MNIEIYKIYLLPINTLGSDALFLVTDSKRNTSDAFNEAKVSLKVLLLTDAETPTHAS